MALPNRPHPSRPHLCVRSRRGPGSACKQWGALQPTTRESACREPPSERRWSGGAAGGEARRLGEWAQGQTRCGAPSRSPAGSERRRPRLGIPTAPAFGRSWSACRWASGLETISVRCWRPCLHPRFPAPDAATALLCGAVPAPTVGHGVQGPLHADQCRLSVPRGPAGALQRGRRRFWERPGGQRLCWVRGPCWRGRGHGLPLTPVAQSASTDTDGESWGQGPGSPQPQPSA